MKIPKQKKYNNSSSWIYNVTLNDALQKLAQSIYDNKFHLS